MGIFINAGVHPDVFMNKGEIEEPNQGYFKLDYFSELVKQQGRVNKSLIRSTHALNSLYKQQENTQASQWEEIGSQLHELKESNLQYEKFKGQAMERLTMLDNNNIKLQRIMENDDLLKQEIINQVDEINKSNKDILTELNKRELDNKQLAMQINELHDLQKHVSSQITKQDNSQDEVLGRLEKQEALMEKTLRQINHFRSVLYERTNYLAERIEDSYNLTSSYVYNLLTGSDQPITIFMANKKKEESKKGIE